MQFMCSKFADSEEVMKMSKKRLQTKGTCFLDVSAEEAQNLLMTQGKDGNFVIRPSETESGNISLSVRHKGSVLHVKIQNTGEMFDLYGGEQFSSLFDLVEYYKDGEKLRLQDGDFICFSQPFFLNTTSDRCERWFHGGITSGAAKEKLKVQSEGSFLVRESQTKEDTFVLSVKTGSDDVTEVIINKTKGRYDIGDGSSFKDLTNLIDHYRKKEITAVMPNKTKLNFTLKKAVNLGEILASDIPTRASELMKQFPGHDKARDGFWEEFEQIAKMEEMEIVYAMTRVVGKKEENVKKNRFKNILPYDETRVILKDHSEGDYINANYIRTKQLKVGDVTETYVATQGCLKQTVGDFWRMVWQEKSSIIVMTTRVVEMGKNKCFQYWPEEEGHSLTFEISNGSFTINFESVENARDFYIRKLQVTREHKTKGKTDSETRVVHHFHFPEWPDKMAPKDEYIDRILDFIQAVNDRRTQLRDSKPVIVHCSAGIGRTGTYVLIDIILQMIKARGLQCPIDIPKILVEMRKMRSGLVQTEAQYRFVYLAIRHFIENRQKKTSPANSSSSSSSSSKDIAENIYANQNEDQNQKQPKDYPSCRKPKPLSPKPTAAVVYENL